MAHREHGGRGQGTVTASREWQNLQANCLWPEQKLYELIRPVVLFDQSRKDRARETGVSAKTLARAVARFVQHGLPGLSPQTGLREDDRRLLPAPIRAHILRLKAEQPTLTAHEFTTICELRFDRLVDARTVTRLLAREPVPPGISRRFPRYAEIADPEERRLAVIRLHTEGWTDTRIGEYLGVARMTVYRVLRRWVEDGVVGLADKPRTHRRTRATTLPLMARIRALQENPYLGRQRVRAALKQLGITVSERTCGRIMALNRRVYGLDIPATAPRERKPMPFATRRPHAIWSVDIRYLKHHHIPQYAGKSLYVITILDNASRAIVASAPSPSQDLTAFLLVLFTAIHAYGAPDMLVSDGGGVFRANAALEIYEQLEIEKAQIARRRPYQNYVESHFNIMRRMADYYFEQATSWDELCAIHARFLANYNWQEHAAHRDREEGMRTPREVLGWFRGRQVEVLTLDEIFRAVHGRRHIDRGGYVQYRYWRLYGEEGLVGEEVNVWLFRETLTIAHREGPVAQYAVTYGSDAPDALSYRRPRPYQTFTAVEALRTIPPTSPVSFITASGTPSSVPQQLLWTPPLVEGLEWRKAIRVHRSPRRRQRRSASSLPQQGRLFA